MKSVRGRGLEDVDDADENVEENGAEHRAQAIEVPRLGIHLKFSFKTSSLEKMLTSKIFQPTVTYLDLLLELATGEPLFKKFLRFH